MVKKLKRAYRQLICKHRWIEIRDPKTDWEFERVRRNPLFAMFPVHIERQCVNCGKRKKYDYYVVPQE
jgi:hypothetical protein